MALNVDSYGMSRTYNNGKLIQGLDYDANYNGDELNLAIQNHDGKLVYMKMDNDEIMELFNQPTHSKSLHDRIGNDFRSSRSLSNRSYKSSRSNSKSKKTTKSKTKPKTRKTAKSKTKPKTRKTAKSKTKSLVNNFNKSYVKSIDKTIY
jgi:hypothetical protein